MKNRVLFVLALVVVFTLGILSIRAWDHYKVNELVKVQASQMQKDHEKRQLEKEVQRLVAAEEKRDAQEAAEKKRLQETCESMEATYEKLTPYQKSITKKPQCDLNQVQ